MKAVYKGETVTISVVFQSGDTFSAPPTWRLLDDGGNSIINGQAAFSSGMTWTATLTVPTSLPLDDGLSEFTLRFAGTTASGVRLVRDKSIYVIDYSDRWQTYGLLISGGSPTIDTTVMYDTQPASMTYLLREGYGELPIAAIEATTAANPAAAALTSKGYAYDLTLQTGGRIVRNSGGFWPYQLVVEATAPSGRSLGTIIQPVYVLTPQIASFTSSVRRMLDKGRIDDIDMNLQWHEDELVHFVIESLGYINSTGDVTFWTVEQLPSTLNDLLIVATCFKALNARYLAEGMNAFDMQGATVSLSFNRLGPIQTKMDEMQRMLESRLPTAKTAAIRSFGRGTPPEGSVQPGVQGSMGVLGINFGPMTNRQGINYANQPNNRGWRY